MGDVSISDADTKDALRTAQANFVLEKKTEDTPKQGIKRLDNNHSSHKCL